MYRKLLATLLILTTSILFMTTVILADGTPQAATSITQHAPEVQTSPPIEVTKETSHAWLWWVLGILVVAGGAAAAAGGGGGGGGGGSNGGSQSHTGSATVTW